MPWIERRTTIIFPREAEVKCSYTDVNFFVDVLVYDLVGNIGTVILFPTCFLLNVLAAKRTDRKSVV